MDTTKTIRDDSALKNVMTSFVESYAGRDKSIEFSMWLAERLRAEMPGMTQGTSEKLTADIIEAVADYDRALSDLNKAIEAGQTKEEWFSDRTAEVYSDMPLNEVGNVLQKVNNDLALSNAQIMNEISDVPEDDVIVADNAEILDWNEYSIKHKTLQLGQQAVMSGIGAAAATIKQSVENGETDDFNELVGQALQEGLETASGEVKAVVAGAVKSAAESGLSDLLPADTPTETICDMAGAAVESAGALYDAATGKIPLTEALDKSGRASVAAVCRWGAVALKARLTSIPVVGPIVTTLAGGLIDHMNSSKFSENVYTVVRDAAVATWEGIKESGRKTFSGIKNSLKDLLFS